ncbi:MAG TPA: hypothetical protein VGK59_16660 [Ohtaekwangia sp.]
MRIPSLAKLIFVLSMLIIAETNAQTKKKEVPQYTPIQMTSIERAFPVVYDILKSKYKISLHTMDWSDKKLQSQFYEFKGTGFLAMQQRARFEVIIDEANTLNVSMVDVQSANSNNEWSSTYPDKVTNYVKVEFTEAIRSALADNQTVDKAMDNFYRDLIINIFFYSRATELAGKKWFDTYLAEKPVKWNLSFGDIAENKNSQFKQKYVETYTLVVDSFTNANFQFAFTRYTNSDANIMLKKGSNVEVTSICKSLRYSNGNFSIVLAD